MVEMSGKRARERKEIWFGKAVDQYTHDELVWKTGA